MTTFTRREAARIAARQARAESDKLIRDARDTADRLGTLTVDEETAVIWLDGHIGQDVFGEVDAVAVRDAMRTLKGREVTFRINSEGGSVDAGLEIYNILREHRGGLITRGNLVASMGAIVFQAGEQRIIEKSGAMMLHAPHARAGGNAAEHERLAKVLKTYAERVVPILASRSGKSEVAIRTLLETETWYSPSQCVSEGFADSVAGRVIGGRPKMAAARRASIRGKMAMAMMDTGAIVAAYGE